MDSSGNEARKRLAEEMQKYVFGLKRHAYRVLNDEDEAQDMVNEAICRAIDKWQSFDRTYHLSTWLYSILRKVIVENLRKKKSVMNLPNKYRISFDEEKVSRESIPPEHLLEFDLKRPLTGEAERIGLVKEDQLLLGKCLAGKSDEVIAKEMCLTVEAMKRRRAKIFRRLREYCERLKELHSKVKFRIIAEDSWPELKTN